MQASADEPQPPGVDGSGKRCVECSYDLGGLTAALCPECATPIDAKPFKGLRIFFVIAAIANGIFILCPSYGLLLCTIYWLSEGYVDSSIAMMGAVFVSTFSGLFASIIGSKNARTLSRVDERRGRIAMINLALLPVWMIAVIAFVSYVLRLFGVTF
jgi:hypothetical protein